MQTRWKEELDTLLSILRKTPLEESVKWGIPVFAFNGRNIVGVAGFKNHFALWFYNAAFLRDGHRVLTNAQEGKTNALRQWRFTSAAQIDEHLILAYVEEAIANEKLGLKWKPKPKEKIPVPKLLADALAADNTLSRSFDNLSPYKRNEYAAYISEAKREATKRSRMEKIKPLILQGMGLHDKYRTKK